MKRRVAVICPAPAGLGGWGYHFATVLAALADDATEVHALGPRAATEWPLAGGAPSVAWHQPPVFSPAWKWRYTPYRWLRGRLMLLDQSRFGKWAAREAARIEPDYCYISCLVGLETLKWAAQAGVPAVLDSAMGSVRHYAEQCRVESRRWRMRAYAGFPTPAGIARAEEEYRLAERIRVCSGWTRDSLSAGGVPRGRISVVPLPIDLVRFRPEAASGLDPRGPLRICYVGALTLAKGFAHLLRAMRQAGPQRTRLEIVGSTGERGVKALLERESAGLNVSLAPGDPRPALHRAEILVLPTLHDGFGLVVAEAMACGLPVIVTGQCGAAELVRPGVSGWIVPAGDTGALQAALEAALLERGALAEMGRAAREEIARFAAPDRAAELRDWFYGGAQAVAAAV